jgi:hypothetical protein
LDARRLALATVLAGTAPAGRAKKAPAAAPATPPTSPALTRDEAKAHAAEIFDKLDFNHDGVFNGRYEAAAKPVWARCSTGWTPTMMVR